MFEFAAFETPSFFPFPIPLPKVRPVSSRRDFVVWALQPTLQSDISQRFEVTFPGELDLQSSQTLREIPNERRDGTTATEMKLGLEGRTRNGV